jgi:hypothetical protein
MDKDLSEIFETTTFNEKLGFLKQPTGFAAKSIRAGQDPNNWKCR